MKKKQNWKDITLNQKVWRKSRQNKRLLSINFRAMNDLIKLILYKMTRNDCIDKQTKLFLSIVQVSQEYLLHLLLNDIDLNYQFFFDLIFYHCFFLLFRYYKCNLLMQKKPTTEVMSTRELQSNFSDIHGGQQCITFISVSHFEMHKLVHDQESFVGKVKTINNQAKRKMEVGGYKQALVMLGEAEKILQYAAGSGKTIERDLIVCVLHNLASAYHKLWMLQKCLSYVQGLIFNLQNHLSSLQNSVVSSSQRHDIQLALQSLQMKQMLAAYYIRFCALNSQHYAHRQALTAARKAYAHTRSLLTFDQSYIKSNLKRDKQTEIKIDLKYRLLVAVFDLQANINIKRHRQILKAAHFCIQIWTKNKEKNIQTSYNYLKNYSIGDFMDFKPKQYRGKKDKLPPQQEKQRQFEDSFVYKLLLLSISLFSVATQIRLSAVQGGHCYSQLQKQSNIQLRQAQAYHLLAIICLSGCIEFDLLFLRHLLNSYSTYFDSGLVDYKTVEPQSLEKVLELLGEQIKPLGSTEVISSEDILPESENNQYRLKDKFFDKIKNDRKNNRLKRKDEKRERVQSKRNGSKNHSSLEGKSLIKDDRLRLKAPKLQNKEKSKSKPKSKSRTLQKKSKQKETNYYFIRNQSKSKKKSPKDELHNITKKFSPRKSKQHLGREPVSDIVSRGQKKSILNQKPSMKKLLTQNKSPRKRINIYGLQT